MYGVSGSWSCPGSRLIISVFFFLFFFKQTWCRQSVWVTSSVPGLTWRERGQLIISWALNTRRTSSFLSLFCLSVSFHLSLLQCQCSGFVGEVVWGYGVKRSSPGRLLCKDFVSSLQLQEGEISNKPFLWRWEGKISDLLWHSFIVAGLCQVCRLWTGRAVFQVGLFLFFFISAQCCQRLTAPA